MAPTTESRPVLGRTVALLVLYALATLVGGALLVGFLHALASIFGPGVMFYRGVIALGGVFVTLVAVLAIALPRFPSRFGVDGADALGAAIVAASLLLAIFVVGPVTVDRSISVFMLSQFDAAPGSLTQGEARDGFVRVYVNDWDQIDRRLKEQEVSGNLERAPDGWRITTQGRAFMKTARTMSRVFGGDPRFVGRKE